MPDWKIHPRLTSQHPLQFVVGGYQHPASKLWQLWVLFDWQNINWVAAYTRQERISEIRKELRLQILPGEPFDRQKALAILDALHDEREADPLPVARYIERTILLNSVWPAQHVDNGES